MRDPQIDTEWHDTREILFWHEQLPFRAKFEVEKLTGVLMDRDIGSPEKLVYRGTSVSGTTRRSLTLRFEAALPRAPYILKPPADPAAYRNLFSLRVETAGPRKSMTEAELVRDAGRAMDHWSLHLTVGTPEIEWTDASPEFYAERVRESLELEDRSRPVDDPAAVALLQSMVLSALRAGKYYRGSHHEGGTLLCFDGTHFVREDFGVEPGMTVFKTDEEMLTCLRNYFYWDSRKANFPHPTPEVEVWTYILCQLSRQPFQFGAQRP